MHASEKEEPDKHLPYISVIAPVYNSESFIALLLDSLVKQDYPRECFEIIIVDNNSTDTSRDIIRQYPVTLLEEKGKQSSYAARNKGIRHAQYDVLAFIDGDCVASRGWLKEGAQALEKASADLVGGRVEFTYSARRTTAELYDSVTNMQVEANIRERNVAKTANLFVRRKVFESVGLFPDDVKSGGDVQWTERATKNGFNLVYSSEAFVQHPARTFSELLVKQLRVGKGMIPIWRNEGRSSAKIGTAILRLLMPPRISVVRKMLSKLNVNDVKNRNFRMWVVSFVCRAAIGLGALSALNTGNISRVKHERE